jgi:hypothetical protein
MEEIVFSEVLVFIAILRMMNVSYNEFIVLNLYLVIESLVSATTASMTNFFMTFSPSGKNLFFVFNSNYGDLTCGSYVTNGTAAGTKKLSCIKSCSYH